MTRNEIAKSLKPIEWAYNHNNGGYTSIFVAGGRSLELVIELLYNSQYVAKLTAYYNNAYAPKCISLHTTLQGAMQEARNFLIDEVCSLFELDEQR